MTSPLMIASIFETATNNPDKPALICGGESVSYRTLSNKINSAATYLKEQGVQRNDRVLLSATNSSPSFVYGYFACHLIGAISVPIDARAASRTLNDIAEQTRPRFSCLAPSASFSFANAPLETLNSDYSGTHKIAIENLDEAADILFTAGTTGKPKGIIQTHRNIKALADGRNSVIGAPARDVIVIPLPLSHGFGLGRLRCTVLVGGGIVLVDGFLFPDKIFRAFDDSAVSGMCCVPSGFASLFQIGGDRIGELRHGLKYIETATAPLPDRIKDRLVRLLPHTRIYNTYGLTETTATIAFVELHSANHPPIPVGKPIPGVEVKIVDEDFAKVPTGSLGQVLVRGDNVMKGYWEDPVRTRDVLIEGWLATNDMGYLDAEGYLYLKGRKEELINVGGLKVAPVEIERVLEEHPAISECACIGIADPTGLMGEVIKAFLVPVTGLTTKPSNAELVEFMRKTVEGYKIPAQFTWIDALPKTSVGKVQRLGLHGRIDWDKESEVPALSLMALIRKTFSLAPDAAVAATDGPGSLDGWDSLGHMKLILAIERAYEVHIEPSEAMAVESVADIIAILERKCRTSV